MGTFRRRNLTHSMIWGTRGAETLRTIWFGEPEAPKPYAQYGLWPRGAVDLCLLLEFCNQLSWIALKATQTTIPRRAFGRHCDRKRVYMALASGFLWRLVGERREVVIIRASAAHNMVWCGAQQRRRPMSFWVMASLLNSSHDIFMVCASFTHSFRMVRSRFVPSPTFPSQAHLILLASLKKTLRFLWIPFWSTLQFLVLAIPLQEP